MIQLTGKISKDVILTKAKIHGHVIRTILCLLMSICLLTACEMPIEKTDGHTVSFPKATLSLTTQNGYQIQIPVELATTEEQRKQGLMHRQKLEQGHGMLFIWPQQGHIAMWMKNTLIPLDMIFIDDDTVVHIHKNAIPHDATLIPAPAPVNKVLELNAGEADTLGLQIGDTINVEGV